MLVSSPTDLFPAELSCAEGTSLNSEPVGILMGIKVTWNLLDSSFYSPVILSLLLVNMLSFQSHQPLIGVLLSS